MIAAGVLQAPIEDARVSVVDARDIAAVAAAALTQAGHTGRTYDVTGPQALSHAEIAYSRTTPTGPDGQVHAHPGLYVLDSATLPGATGANPSMTIAAVAERCIERVIRRLTGDADWAAPEHADVVRRPMPEDAAIAALLARR